MKELKELRFNETDIHLQDNLVRGSILPEKTVEGCLNSDSVLLGAVGGYKWDDLPGDMRPEKGLLRIRRAMGLYSNIRPAKLWKALADASPLKKHLVENGVEIIVVRELTGGIYFGERGRYEDEKMGETAWDTEKYSVTEIRRITKIACELARKRSGKVISVDKANVLESSSLWRKTVHEYAEENYPDVTVTDMRRELREGNASALSAGRLSFGSREARTGQSWSRTRRARVSTSSLV